MNRSRLIFFFAVLAVVLGIARCNSRTTSQRAETKPGPSPSPPAGSLLIPSPVTPPRATSTASAAAQVSPAQEFDKPAERIAPSVVALSVFDTAGRLLHNGTGFFISDDGKIVTSRSIVDGASYAIAKSRDDKIWNVMGILAESAASDVAILKAQVKEKVPFVTPDKTAPFDAGGRLAAVGSSQNHRNNIAQTSIAGRKSDNNSEWLELTTPLPGESLGAPVITNQGHVLGFVALQRGQGPAVNVVRMASALDSVFARIDPRAKPGWAETSKAAALPPAEGPVEKPKVSPTPPAQRGGLVYSPNPQYPVAARRARVPAKGTGRYRVHFSRDGSVRDIQIIQSTRNPILDGAAVDTLRRWRATPGQEWTASVPITFQP